MKLSFIVPIYNVKPYLRKCVDSLLHQDYDDYEIILVDDGSTDGSGELADEIVEELSLSLSSSLGSRCGCRSLHQPNAGLSAARNAGLKFAQGEYICFVDSDDYWEPNVLGSLMAQVERDQLDVLRFRYQNVRPVGTEGNNEVFHPYKTDLDYNDYSPLPIDGRTFLNERMGTQCYAWAYILRRDLMNDCLFTPGIFFEDTDWTPRMLLRAGRVASTELVVYNYLWRQGSITLATNLDKIRKGVDDKILLMHRLKEWGGEMPWFKGMIANTMLAVVGALSGPLYAHRHSYLLQLQALNVFPLTDHLVNPRARRKLRLLNLSPRLAVFLLHLKNH